jgi:hypothetical protein
MSSTFIVGCARSGTTSLLKVLGLSRQATCLVEPMPNLNIESREMFEGRLGDPYKPLAEHVAPRVAKGLSKRRHYVEKQLAFVPFIPQLDQLFRCRFVIPIRDGRHVVRSLINWHNQMFPLLYQECRERGELSDRAEKVLARQVGIDPYDYSLPRPGRDDPWHDSWQDFSRFEMVTWFWAYINRLALNLARRIDHERVLIIDYTKPTVESIRRVYEFIGLTDFDETAVSRLLNSSVNSLQDRIGETGRFPAYPQWSDAQKQRFWELAFDTMQLLGYDQSASRPEPPSVSVGTSLDPRSQTRSTSKDTSASHENISGIKQLGIWNSSLSEISSLEFRLNSIPAPLLKSAFHEWMNNIGKITSSIKSVAQEGAPWSDAQIGRLASKRESMPVLHKGEDAADLVVSFTTLETTYDMDAALRALARRTGRVLYAVHGAGYFGNMNGHRYRWDANACVSVKEASPGRFVQILKDEGFQSVVVLPQATGDKSRPAVTVLIASRDKVDAAALMQGHTIHTDFAPYRAQSSGWLHRQVVQSVNLGCFYFGEAGLDLANDLGYFRTILSTLSQAENLRCGTVEELATGAWGVNIALRADVDMDLVAAGKMAGIAKEFGVPLTSYLLHTAPYYGYFQDGLFHRHDDNAPLYRQIQSGGEVGLHIDPYSIYLDQGIDGAEAVKMELAWLRSIGLRIIGTSGHNAAPVYGAESCEILKGRTIRQGDWFHRNYTYLPLGVLDESKLCLDYEAGLATPARPNQPIDEDDPYLAGLPEGDFLRDFVWFRAYLVDNAYCRWGYDYNIWLLGKDMWAIGGRDPAGNAVFHFDITWSKVAEFLNGIRPAEKTLITLHPIYLGKRSQPGVAPNDPGVIALAKKAA